MCRNKHNKRSGKHSGKCIKSGNNECRKCPKSAKNIRKNIPCDKVNVLSFDWNLNLKYRAQVVDFEAKMLSFSLNESVLVHEDWAQSNQLVQDQFGLHQDRIALTEETLRSLKTKVRVSSSESVLTLAEISLYRFPILRGVWTMPT